MPPHRLGSASVTEIRNRLDAKLIELRVAGRRPCRISVTPEEMRSIAKADDDGKPSYVAAPAEHPRRPTYQGVPIYDELSQGPAEILCDDRAGKPARFIVLPA
ncbi:hypothetical protein BH11PSE1_BH11PSE1_10480 [soil metagenome]